GMVALGGRGGGEGGGGGGWRRPLPGTSRGRGASVRDGPGPGRASGRQGCVWGPPGGSECLGDDHRKHQHGRVLRANPDFPVVATAWSRCRPPPRPPYGFPSTRGHGYRGVGASYPRSRRRHYRGNTG